MVYGKNNQKNDRRRNSRIRGKMRLEDLVGRHVKEMEVAEHIVRATDNGWSCGRRVEKSM